MSSEEWQRADRIPPWNISWNISSVRSIVSHKSDFVQNDEISWFKFVQFARPVLGRIAQEKLSPLRKIAKNRHLAPSANFFDIFIA